MDVIRQKTVVTQSNHTNISLRAIWMGIQPKLKRLGNALTFCVYMSALILFLLVMDLKDWIKDR